jgi:hypothetical protein
MSLPRRLEPRSLFNRLTKSWAPLVNGALTSLFAHKAERTASFAGSLAAFAHSWTIAVILPPKSMYRAANSVRLASAVFLARGRMIDVLTDGGETAFRETVFLPGADLVLGTGLLDGAAFFAVATLLETANFLDSVAIRLRLSTLLRVTRLFAIGLPRGCNFAGAFNITQETRNPFVLATPWFDTSSNEAGSRDEWQELEGYQSVLKAGIDDFGKPMQGVVDWCCPI